MAEEMRHETKLDCVWQIFQSVAILLRLLNREAGSVALQEATRRAADVFKVPSATLEGAERRPLEAGAIVCVSAASD